MNYYVEYDNQLYKDDDLEAKNPAFSRVLDLDWGELVTYDDSKEDVTLMNYIKEHGFPNDLQHAIDGILPQNGLLT